MKIIGSVLLCLIVIGSKLNDVAAESVFRTDDARISIDGLANESDWKKAKWKTLSHHITGSVPGKADFNGRYKLLWDTERIYILTEIVDDVLFDKTADPLSLYWDDDCLEIFIDEDQSGGNHLHNFNAFAYHIALDNQAVDMAEKDDNGKATIKLFNDHVASYWRRSSQSPEKIIWEVALKIFDENLKQVRLSAGKKMGFMVAYCDNDGSAEREHFMGSHAIEPVNGDKNRGYIDANVFGRVKLVE